MDRSWTRHKVDDDDRIQLGHSPAREPGLEIVIALPREGPSIEIIDCLTRGTLWGHALQTSSVGTCPDVRSSWPIVSMIRPVADRSQPRDTPRGITSSCRTLIDTLFVLSSMFYLYLSSIPSYALSDPPEVRSTC